MVKKEFQNCQNILVNDVKRIKNIVHTCEDNFLKQNVDNDH